MFRFYILYSSTCPSCHYCVEYYERLSFFYRSLYYRFFFFPFFHFYFFQPFAGRSSGAEGEKKKKGGIKRFDFECRGDGGGMGGGYQAFFLQFLFSSFSFSSFILRSVSVVTIFACP